MRYKLGDLLYYENGLNTGKVYVSVVSDTDARVYYASKGSLEHFQQMKTNPRIYFVRRHEDGAIIWMSEEYLKRNSRTRLPSWL